MNPSGTIDFALTGKLQKRIRTLIVDDSAMAIGFVRTLLGGRPEIEIIGFASDGEEGVFLADGLQPDLVLMDLQMPKLDGLRATRMIRGRIPGVRVIVITGDRGEEVRQQCTGSGADGFVTKDRLYQDLFSEIERIFEAGVPE